MSLNGYTYDDVAEHFLIEEWDEKQRISFAILWQELTVEQITERGKDWIYNGQTDLLDLYEFKYEYDPEDAYLEILEAPEHLAGFFCKSTIVGDVWKSNFDRTYFTTTSN